MGYLIEFECETCGKETSARKCSSRGRFCSRSCVGASMRSTSPKPPCSVKGCERSAYARGMCNPHYQRDRKWGHPLGAAPHALSPGCAVEGCDLKRKARGYCQNHYDRYRIYGDPLAGVYAKEGVETLVPRGTSGRPSNQTPYLPTEPLVAFFSGGFDIPVRLVSHWRRLRDKGSAPFYSIDNFCCGMGFHPALVYGDAWWDKEYMKEEVAA